MNLSRRNLVAGACAGAAYLATGKGGFALASTRGKRVTLLHFLGRLDLTLNPEGGVADHAFQLIPIHASDFAEEAELAGIVKRVLEPYRSKMDEGGTTWSMWNQPFIRRWRNTL